MADTQITTAVREVLAVPLQFRDQKVITLAMMDKAHQRVAGTAKRNFREHRDRLAEGRHYFELNQRDEIRSVGLVRPQGGTPESLVLLTERGYLMLAKSFNDDLAWQVQEWLVDLYFRVKEQQAPQPLPAWSRRIGFFIPRYRSRMADVHPDRWAVVTETSEAILVVEDVLVLTGFPLRELDLPDGSVGQRWANHRRALGLECPVLQDVELHTPNPNCPVVRPNNYPLTELPLFKRWFHQTYLREGLPDYLVNKVQREASRWLGQGLSVPSPCAVAQAADEACFRITNRHTSIPGSQPLLGQAGLFDNH